MGLFVLDDSAGEIPSIRTWPQVSVRPVRGFTVASWRSGGLVYELVSDVDEPELRRMLAQMNSAPGGPDPATRDPGPGARPARCCPFRPGAPPSSSSRRSSRTDVASRRGVAVAFRSRPDARPRPDRRGRRCSLVPPSLGSRAARPLHRGDARRAGGAEPRPPRRPGVIVLSVDLPGGQNGYLLVGKLKKDEELRGVPVVIVGNPEGFSAHAKLKNRADEYLAKPVDIEGLVAVVGRLTGTADEPAPPPEEEATVSGDPDLDLIDAAFDEAPAAPRPAAVRPRPAPRTRRPRARRQSQRRSGRGRLLLAERRKGPPWCSSRQPPAAPPPPEPEPESLRLELTPAPLRGAGHPPGPPQLELTPARSGRWSEGSGLPQLELTPAALREMETPGPAGPARRAAVGAGRRAGPGLRRRGARHPARGPAAGERRAPGRQETARRDRETLRLKSELEAAQQAIADLRDQQTQGEQKALELSGELSRRDSQLKSLQAKLDQALQEKRRLEQALHSARADAGAAEQLDLVQQELVAARRDLELNRAHAEGAERQLSGLRERAENAEAELPELRARADESAAQAGELEALQGRVTELEAEARKHEDRVTRLYARLKSEERAREKARKAVAVTAQLLAEPRPAPGEPRDRAASPPARTSRRWPEASAGAPEDGYFSSFFGAFFFSIIFLASSWMPEGTFLFFARSFTSLSRSWARNFIATGSGTLGFLVSASFTGYIFSHSRLL